VGRAEVQQGQFLRRALSVRGVNCSEADAAYLVEALLDLAEAGLLVPVHPAVIDTRHDRRQSDLYGSS
jgi:hypothetical protein